MSRNKDSPARRKRRALDLSSGQIRAQLNRVYKRDRGICQLCGLPCTREEASREHKIPLSLGGSRDDGNVDLAHRRCNELANELLTSNRRNHTTQSPGWEDPEKAA
jgi:5-methylcytosine-specific restriction endonuclease McrA